MTETLGIPSMSTFAIQSKIASSISTGNMLLDFIAISFASTIIGGITKAIMEGRVFEWLYSNYTWVVMNIKTQYKRWYDYWYGTVKTERREIIVEEINTTNKTLNYIYPAVYSYVTSLVDLTAESSLTISSEQTLALDERDKPQIKICKEPAQMNTKEFDFRGYKLNYVISQNPVTIYGSEKERKKNNARITISVNIPKTDKRDILNEFVEHCIVTDVKQKSNSTGKIKVFVNDKNGQWTNEKTSCLRNIDSLVLKEGQKERIVKDVQRFVNGEEWYIKRDIDWKRGYLFYGLCGTGKTSLIKGLAKMTERNIYYLSLMNVTDDEQLRKLFTTIDFRKSVIVIEDIDATATELHSRTNGTTGEAKAGASDAQSAPAASATSMVDAVALLAMNTLITGAEKSGRMDPSDPRTAAPTFGAKKSNVTLAGVLNVLDGVFTSHGRLLFVTSNNPRILDKALLRAGRIDVKEHISRCDTYQICELLQNFYELEKLPEDYVDRIAQLPAYKWSPAEVSEIMLSNMEDLARTIYTLETKIPELEELF